MDDRFFQSLDDQTAVLTANRRLANYLHYSFADYQRRQNQLTWKTPTIHPLSNWIEQQWRSLNPAFQLLTSLQERTIWKNISQQNWNSTPLIQQAWNHLIAWGIPLQDLKNSDNDTVQTFYQWALQFSTLCQKNHWITTGELPQQLIDHLTELRSLPTRICLIGFDDLPPKISNLLDHLSAHCSIETIKETKQKTNIKRYEFKNTESELESMANWAYQEHQKNPNKKIACVVGDLASTRQHVSRIFYDVFNNPALINISAGESLKTFPIIQTALQGIALLGDSFNDNDWESLLQSPYLMVSHSDNDVGALADKMRRSHNLSHIGAHALLPILTSLQQHFPDATFLKRWNTLLSSRKSLPQSQKPSEWVHTFTLTLQQLQWPGSRTLDSIEHQLLQRWIKALDEFSCCDSILGSVSFETAFLLFKNHISDIVFQAKSAEAPVQILGILETAGISFDALWIMGMNNEKWPPPPSPNPFLPFQLQVEHKMPHASAARELTFTQQTLNRLFNSAQEIHLSSPQFDGDRQLMPSSLIHSFPLSASNSLPSSTIKESFLLPTDFEKIVDDQAPALHQHEKSVGGTAIFKYQALCPFSAFANLRLKADSLDTPKIGLSGKHRGQLLHRILQALWQNLKTQENLLSLTEESISELISKMIESTCADLTISKTEQVFLNTEKIRLKKVITEWLSIEKERPPFTVIAQEAERKLNINGLNIQCRIDRIDTLPTGEQLVIDYKSGYTSINDWFSARPTEPQLPIYCVFGDDTPSDGIAFAQIRAGAVQFKALINEKLPETNMPSVYKIDEIENDDNISSWPELITHWKNTLENLSHEFSTGNAEVAPLENACDYCELQPLCRVKLCQN